jgi:antitoxin component YwqK of YwqJK toxin-antitoxin module
MLKNLTKCVGLVVVLGGLQALAAAPQVQCPTGASKKTRDDGSSLVTYCVLNGTTTWHGPQVRTYRTGELKETGQWENGARVGTFTAFDQKGGKMEEVQFRANNFHGERREFHTNGQLKRVERYDAGLKVGLVEDFDKQGQKVRTAQAE